MYNLSRHKILVYLFFAFVLPVLWAAHVLHIVIIITFRINKIYHAALE